MYKKVRLKKAMDLCRFCASQVWDKENGGFVCVAHATPFFSGCDVGCTKFLQADLRYVLSSSVGFEHAAPKYEGLPKEEVE